MAGNGKPIITVGSLTKQPTFAPTTNPKIVSSADLPRTPVVTSSAPSPGAPAVGMPGAQAVDLGTSDVIGKLPLALLAQDGAVLGASIQWNGTIWVPGSGTSLAAVIADLPTLRGQDGLPVRVLSPRSQWFYVAAGSGLTVDHLNVEATADGGNTRWARDPAYYPMVNADVDLSAAVASVIMPISALAAPRTCKLPLGPYLEQRVIAPDTDQSLASPAGFAATFDAGIGNIVQGPTPGGYTSAQTYVAFPQQWGGGAVIVLVSITTNLWKVIS